MVILEVRSIETCPEALLLFLFFILACCTYTYSLSHRPLHPKGLSRPAALKYHTYEFCRPKQNSLFFFFPFVIVLYMCYSILFFSLREPEPSLRYLPPTYLPHSSLLSPPPEKPKLFSLSLSKPVSFFSLLSPRLAFPGGKRKTEDGVEA